MDRPNRNASRDSGRSGAVVTCQRTASISRRDRKKTGGRPAAGFCLTGGGSPASQEPGAKRGSERVHSDWGQRI